MKRKSARQLVRLLSDIRYAKHCTTLRAAATNREIAVATAERNTLDEREDGDDTETSRDFHQAKTARSGS
jgi:hypothetical protein